MNCTRIYEDIEQAAAAIMNQPLVDLSTPSVDDFGGAYTHHISNGDDSIEGRYTFNITLNGNEMELCCAANADLEPFCFRCHAVIWNIDDCGPGGDTCIMIRFPQSAKTESDVQDEILTWANTIEAWLVSCGTSKNQIISNVRLVPTNDSARMPE